MTIYYVNPQIGSNAASGLSWANAWRHLPGNGTAILPGDEIRYAKSAIVTTSFSSVTTFGSAATNETAAGRIFFPTSTSGSNITYGYRAAPTSITAAHASVTASSGALIFTPGATVPADTKLGYAAFSQSLSSILGAMIGTKQRGLPTGVAGTYLKIVLCSDTLGNTPILTLDGPTLYAHNTASQVRDARTNFKYAADVTASYTVASVAVYSVASFVVDAAPDITSFQMVGGMLLTPGLSSANLIPAGAGIIRPFPTLQGSSAVMPVPNVYTVHGPIAGTTHMAMYPGSTRGFVATTNQSISVNPTYYEPINYTDPAMLIPTAVTFSGSLGSPIRIRGGFNTGTDTQDGYTNIGFSLGYTAEQMAFIVFSSGGDYLELENFVGGLTPLIGYTASTPLASLKFSQCCLPGGREGLPGPIAVDASAFTIDSLVFEQCSVNGMHLVTRSRQLTLESLASMSLTVDTLRFTDCWLGVLMNPYMPLHVNGSLLIESTAPDLSVLYAQAQQGAVCNVTFEAGATFFVNDTVAMGQQGFAQPGAAVISAAVNDLSLAYFNSGVNTTSGVQMAINSVAGLSFFGFLSTTIDGMLSTVNVLPSLDVTGAAGTAMERTALLAAHDYAVTISGTVSAPEASLNLEIRLYNLNGACSLVFTSPAYARPGLRFNSCNGSLANKVLGYVTTYYPADYLDTFPVEQQTGLVLNACDLYLMCAEGPIDLVKAYGCTLRYGSVPANYPSFTANLGPFLSNFLGYGCTLAMNGVDGYHPSPTNLAGDTPGALLFGTTGTWRARHTSGESHKRWPTIHGTDDLVFNLTSYAHTDSVLDFSSTSMCFVRTPSKFFFAQGRCLAYADPAVNEYGQHDIMVRGRFKVARLQVLQGVSYEITCTVRAVGNPCIFKLMVLPGLAMATDIHQHVLHRYLPTVDVDQDFSFSFTPEADGMIDIAVYGSGVPSPNSTAARLRLRRFLVS